MTDAICRKNLPIVLEETFDRTLKFIEQISGRTPVIIPHLGLLNGGFERLHAAGVWEAANVYADTALAGIVEINTFLEKYGADRLIFGSDSPFGHPGSQLDRLQSMGIADSNLEKICSEKIMDLIRQ